MTFVPDVSYARNGKRGTRIDAESETFVADICPTIDASYGRLYGQDNQNIDSGAEMLIPIAFGCKDSVGPGENDSDISPTLRKMGHNKSHPNAGGQIAVTVALRGREGGGTAEVGDDVSNALRSPQGGSDKAHVMQPTMGVRRLTPRECEKLQGVPEDYTLIPYRGKLASDGPRYAALGNAWAVPCVKWIFDRIEQMRHILEEYGVE